MCSYKLKTTAVLLVTVALTFAFGLYAEAQPFAGVPVERYIPDSVIQNNEAGITPELEHSLAALVEALSATDNVKARLHMESVKDWKNSLGSKNLFFASRVLTLKADQFARKGNMEWAVQAAEDATAISPDDYRARLALANHRLALDIANPQWYVTPLFYAALTYFKDLANLKTFFLEVLQLVIPAMFLAFAIFIISNLIIYIKPIANDICRNTAFDMKLGTAGAMLVLITIAVLLYGGLLWLMLVSALLLRGYMKTRAALMTALFLIFLAASPFLIKTVLNATVSEKSQFNQLVKNYTKGDWGPETLETFKMAAERGQQQKEELLYAVSTLYRKLGQMEEADQYLKRYQSRVVNSAKGIVEQGNIHFGLKEFGKSVTMYKKALELEPALVEAHYNLSITYTEQFKTEEAAGAFNMAMQVDRKKTERLVKTGGDKKTGKIVSIKADLKPMSQGEPGAVTEADELASSIRLAFTGNISEERYLIGSIAFFALFVVLGPVLRRFDNSTHCTSCGNLFLPALKGADFEKIKCNQCLILSSSRKNIAIAKKDKKNMEIREYQYNSRKKTNRLNLILPGLGSIYGSSYIMGSIALGLVSVFIVKLVFTALLVLAGNPDSVTAHPVVYILWGVTFLIFYLVSAIALHVEE